MQFANNRGVILSLEGAVRRRELLTLFGSVAMWPLAARAQQGDRLRRIGVLMAYAEDDPEAQSWLAAFKQRLETQGWTEGHNLRIDAFWAAGDISRATEFAKKLVTLQPEVILSNATPETEALYRETRVLPLVFVNVSDPIGSGFVESLPRPGGTSPASSTWKHRWSRSGWSCSTRSRPA